MKNKEIEELKYKNIPVFILKALGDLTNGAINYYQAPKTTLEKQNIILSYIEQLENNRDKAIEYIEIELSQGGERELRDLVDGYEVLKLLKGGSDYD